MSRSGRETLPDVREWSGGPPECPRLVGRPSQMSGSGRYACRMFGSCRKAIPNVREWWRPSRMSESGRVALPGVR